MRIHNHKPDDSERRKWQNPEKILADIGLSPGMTFIDIGCGSGYFSLPASRIAGVCGNVWGIDINPDLIREMGNCARREGLTNLNLICNRAEETVIGLGLADIVFFGVVLHDFDDPSAVLRNASLMIKPEGRLVNLDWKSEPMKWGPALHKRFSFQKASGLIQDAGFQIQKLDNSNPYHYMITATK